MFASDYYFTPDIFQEPLSVEPDAIELEGSGDQLGHGNLNNTPVLDEGVSVLPGRGRYQSSSSGVLNNPLTGPNQHRDAATCSVFAESAISLDSRAPTLALERQISSVPPEFSTELLINETWGSTAFPSDVLMSENLTHENTLQWTCNICGLRFSTAHELESHARFEKHNTYQCTELNCGRSYYRRDSYVRHMGTHTKSMMYECDICRRTNRKKAFKRRDHLLQHRRSAHLHLLNSSTNYGRSSSSVHLCGQGYQHIEDWEASSLASSTISQSCSVPASQESTLALRKALGNDHPAVRFIDEKLVSNHNALKAELANIFAVLTLHSPTTEEKEQLEALISEPTE